MFPLVRMRHRTDPTPHLDLFSNMLDRLWEGELPLFEGGYYPPLELSDTDESVMVQAELPGLKPEDIELSVEGSVLTMSGEKKESSEKADGNYHHSERRYGSFRRVVTLPSEVNTEKVTTEFDNGILTITLPKVQESRRKRIEVKPK